ncbi:MAG: LacI family DNA-binding transcriptional regulator [Phycisphaeraceae bacterium JB051]
MTVTIRDIADKLKLSPSTVSRSLAGSPRIHPKTRAEVTQMAAHLGYNYSQRSSREKPSKLQMQIGVLLRSTQSHESRVATQMLQGITSEIDRTDLSVSIHAARDMDSDDIKPADLPKVISGYGCDAVILEGRYTSDLVARIAEHVPVVTMSWLYPGIKHDAALAGDSEGINLMVDHLVELGHQKLAYIGLYHPASFAQSRQAGFIQGCLNNQLDITTQQMVGESFFDANRQPDIDALKRMLNDGVTGFVCVNDLVATRIYDQLQSLDIRVPEDVSITGFDNAYTQLDRSIALTTIEPHFASVGRMAVQLAMRRLSQPLSDHVHAAMQGELLIGQSTGKVRA